MANTEVKHRCDSAGFPWRCHRTLREVAQTEELRRRAITARGGGQYGPGVKKLSPEEVRRLEQLTAKERAHNPPRLPPKDEPA